MIKDIFFKEMYDLTHDFLNSWIFLSMQSTEYIFCRPVAEGPWLELEIQPFSEILRCFIFAHYYIQLHTKIIDKGECIVTKSQSVVTWGQRLFIWYWLIRLVIYCFNSSSLVFDFGWNKDEDSDFAADFRSLSCHDFLFVVEIHLNLNSHTGGW